LEGAAVPQETSASIEISTYTTRRWVEDEETALVELLPPATDSVGVYLLRYTIALFSIVVKSIDEEG
jgi:hypothetical protein